MDEKPQIPEDDWGMVNFAVGMLLGVAMKHGAVDVLIYYNSLRIRIEHVEKEDKT
jgi:hypothetical protein